MKLFSKKQAAEIQTRECRMLYILLSFFIPFLVLTLALTALHVAPFGKHNLAISDGKFYINGEMFFKRLLLGEENILYSFNNGLGGNEWSLFAWGGFSFGNLLSCFAKLETIPTVFTWICVVNLSLCGLTMYILLAYVNGHKLSNLVFSTSYALIGFNVVNCYQTGFVLGPEMLPLVILGLIMLLRGKSPVLYILSLAFCAFFNFYFAFHLCVISLIYFLAYICVNERELKGKIKKITVQWLVASVIGGLLAAPMWLPTLKAYSGGGRLDQTAASEYTFNENMPFIRIFSKLFSGANSTNELVVGLPNVFCGILVLALVVLYFMNKKVDIRRKRAAGIVLGFYLLTFYIHAFTLVMHGGTHTNWFPYRYSYVFSFLLICLAAEEFRYIDEITFQDTKRCGIALVVFALLVFDISYEYVSGGSVLLDFLLLALMWLGFRFYKTRPDKAPLSTFSLLLLILVCINLYANYIISTKKVQEWELDLEEYNKNILVSGALIDALNMADNSFFRMEKDKSESGSVAADPYLYNYNGVSHSGPGGRMFIHKGLNKLGINWYDMRHWYSEGIPAATDTLLGLKYLISERDLSEEKEYEKKIGIEDTYIYVNSNPLNVSVLSDGEIQNLELSDNVFENLNQVWKSMTGGGTDIFTMQDDITFTAKSAVASQSVNSSELVDFYKNKEEQQEQDDYEDPNGSYIEYSFVTTKDGPVYVFDTSTPSSRGGLPTPSIRYCGSYKAGDTVTGHFDIINSAYITDDVMRGYCANMVFASANNEVLVEYAKLLNNRNISFNVIHENDLSGEFTAEEGKRILFTIPWDEGWTCTIDGQKVPIDKTWDLFMSVEVPEGHHSYEMKFIPAWLNYGLILCGIAFVGLIVFMILWGKQSKKLSLLPETSEHVPAPDDETAGLTNETVAATFQF